MNSFRIPLIKPHITPESRSLIDEVLDSGYLTEGPMVRRFCDAISRFTGLAFSVAFNSCTTGLETALRVAGVGAGDEVIVPDFTYPATAHAVRLTGALPVMVDVDPDTMLIDKRAVESAMKPDVKAIVPVSLFGNPLDYDWLAQIKTKHGLWIVEDAACSLGSVFRGRAVGTDADMAVFSFHPRKFVTTGEGGVVTTQNPEWADALKQYKHFGAGGVDEAGRPVFSGDGTNYKMSDVLAALGLGQMNEIDDLLDERRFLASRYDQMLVGAKNIRPAKTTPNGRHSFQSYVVKIPNRDHVLDEMRRQGIEVQIGTYALHRQPAFQNGRDRLEGPFPGSTEAFSQSLVLPLYHGMTEAEQTEVVQTLMQCVG